MRRILYACVGTRCTVSGRWNYYKTRCAVSLLVIFMAAIIFSGCEGKHKALVSAHKAVGELLVSTKDQAKVLYTQGIINESTYKSIRINWLKAQKSYLEASDILETILDTNATDVSRYTALITQVSTIVSDIAIWLEEDKKQ